MAAPKDNRTQPGNEQGRSRSIGAFTCSALISIAALAWTGCAGSPEPDFATRPTEAKAEIERTKQAAEADAATVAPPEPAAAAEAAPAEAPAEPSTRERTEPLVGTEVRHFKTATIVEPEPEPPTLFEAAQAERERRQLAAPAKVVITDANLNEFAAGRELTELITDRAVEEAASGDSSSPEVIDDEAYWRQQVRDARLAWRAAADRSSELEDEVAKLRYDFYATDDAYYRDSVIKTDWDRTANELAQARLRVGDLELRVRQLLEEGYAAGALPGWLREGIDFEPPASEQPARQRRTEELPVLQVGEPTIAAEPPR